MKKSQLLVVVSIVLWVSSLGVSSSLFAQEQDVLIEQEQEQDEYALIEEVVTLGSRARPRSVTGSPAPVMSCPAMTLSSRRVPIWLT